ncbi:hypothetical protein [Candidatus Entotheonella palauensis]|uniref:Uncharacterized protein n=1 Tax=Candidatus Entotheonella gemina TaxID=1429439 RepID=W4M199_9BACT|nr:hypothetical protein [Candidatus Entotheonella palauensis]ETX03736.1 MAG: hypothetical protein ETSY2_32700 [Candidatus Entotheonella gemina]
MSAIVLQRVVVRMMYDPAFRKRVYANPERTLRDVPLTPQERQWLVTPAPSAYGTDGYRSSRALTGLLEEFPVAGALAVRLPRGIQRLQQFFATPSFHQCVQERGSMAAAFGAYLGSEAFRSRKTPLESAHIARVETGIAQVRRSSPPLSFSTESVTAETRFGLAPWVALLTVHPDTLDRYSALLASLRQYDGSLIEAVLDTQHHLPTGPAFRGKATAYVLVSHIPGSDGPSLESMSDDLGNLLAAVRTPRLLGEVWALVEEMGCEPQEARDVIAGLVEDRILRRMSN